MKVISLERVRRILKRDVAPFRPPGVTIKASYSDNKYLSPSRADLTTILAQCAKGVPSNLAFTDELFDCDDFSYVLKGQVCLYGLEEKLEAPLVLGIAWGNFEWRSEFHAVNWSIVDGDRVVWIEAQELSEDKDWGIRGLSQCSGNLRTLIT